MSQHPIDLLPDSIRARTLAGVRLGRYIGTSVLAALILVVGVMHTRIDLATARRGHEAARMQADLVLRAEGQIADLRGRIVDIESFMDRYHGIAMPLDVSSVLATTINEMPQGMSLDRVDLDAGARRRSRSPRDIARSDVDGAPPRELLVELSGFAPDDSAIATYVSRLEAIRPFSDVSLDFSRTRSVRERSAREFRLSFRIDLEERYAIHQRSAASSSVALEETDRE